MKKQQAPQPLSDIEYDTLWMAVRYALPRMTIACSTLPSQIAQAYGHRLKPNQAQLLVRDIREYIKDAESALPGEMWNTVDRPGWEALANALDPKSHFDVTAHYEGKTETYRCFYHEGNYVVVSDYFKTGKRKMYLNSQYLQNVKPCAK